MHIVKNVCNNFLTRKVFKLPVLSPLVSQSHTANFSDLKTFYDHERRKPLRIAHNYWTLVQNLKQSKK